jgi:hypothetical protein
MRRKSVEVPAEVDPRSEATALLRRLIDDGPLREAVAGVLAEAEESKTGAPAAGAKLGLGKLIVLASLGAAGALGASPGLRSKLLDALFGAEEEFEYSPPAEGPGLSAV